MRLSYYFSLKGKESKINIIFSRKKVIEAYKKQWFFGAIVNEIVLREYYF